MVSWLDIFRPEIWYTKEGLKDHMDILALKKFAEGLKAKFALPESTSPEDQLKPGVAVLFEDAGTKYGLTVKTRTETYLAEHKVRPDIAIYVGGLIGAYRLE